MHRVDRKVRRKYFGLWLMLLVTTGSASLAAEALLVGNINFPGEIIEFTLDAKSREEIVGGEIRLAGQRYEITHVSAHRLIGAQHTDINQRAYVVFSSSFSDETGTGKPWIAANTYLGCDQQYNSFLALYRIDPVLQSELPALPYGALTDSDQAARTAAVFCFVTAPPNK